MAYSRDSISKQGKENLKTIAKETDTTISEITRRQLDHFTSHFIPFS